MKFSLRFLATAAAVLVIGTTAQQPGVDTLLNSGLGALNPGTDKTGSLFGVMPIPGKGAEDTTDKTLKNLPGLLATNPIPIKGEDLTHPDDQQPLSSSGDTSVKSSKGNKKKHAKARKMVKVPVPKVN